MPRSSSRIQTKPGPITPKEAEWRESAEAIAAVDAIFAGVGMGHGRRSTLAGTWKNGERVKSPRSTKAKAAQPRRGQPGVVHVPAFDAIPWLRSGFSTRHGGATTAYTDTPASELNLGWTRDDPAENTRENRARFVSAVSGGSPMQLAAVRQSHSGIVRVLQGGHGPLAQPNGTAVLRGDAIVTDLPGVLLGVQTADCIPVLVVDPVKRVVAAFHAGWRGTLKRIVERGIGTLQLRYGSNPADILAAVGPGIGACCYAVGEEVRFEFESQFAYGRDLFTEVYDSDPVKDKYPLLFLTARAPGHSNIGPQIHIDLWEANRRQLMDAGVPAANISVVGECTGCTREKNGSRRYFSHRAEHGFTGRMMSVIGIAPDA